MEAQTFLIGTRNQLDQQTKEADDLGKRVSKYQEESSFEANLGDPKLNKGHSKEEKAETTS